MNAIAIGILVFLLWDVLTHAWNPIDEAFGHHEIGGALTRGAVLTTTFGIGLLGLVWFDRSHNHRPNGAVRGPGAAMVGELATSSWVAGAGRLAVMIATGIGLHNFAEGLAIGNSAAAGDITLALMLVIGFGLHNATEGFGIVAPLDRRPAFLGCPGCPRYNRRRPNIFRHTTRPTLHER